MKLEESKGIETKLEDSRRRDVNEMHLVDRNTRRERALCGADGSDDERMGVAYYLEMRKDGFGVGTVCEGCKARGIPFAVNLAQDLEAEGLLDEAEEYRQLVHTLSRETGQSPPRR